MKPADILMRSAAWWLAAVLPLGVLLRSAFVWIYTPGPFFWGHLIHAHSHTAYFGWVGLGLMGLILHLLPGLTGHPVPDSRPLRWLLRLAPWAVGGAIVTFAWWGYTGPSIAFAALNEVLWFLFAVVFWREVRGRPVRDWPAALWLMGTAVCLLLLSTLGTLLIILSRAVFDSAYPLLYQGGVYLFLQVYGDGWLEVGLMGAVLAIGSGHAPALTGQLAGQRMAWERGDGRRLAFRTIALAALLLMAPASLRLLVPYGLEGPVAALGALAGVALGLVQIWFLLVARRVRLPEPARPWWLLAGYALAVKAGLEFMPLLPGWSDLVLNRSLVVAFLHLKLLLIVSSVLLGALALVRGRSSRVAFGLFAGGAGMMVAALVAHGLLTSARPDWSESLYLLAFVASIPAALGGIWAAVVRR